jgi:glycosyltransferase involved in cell wall biosynthesis
VTFENGQNSRVPGVTPLHGVDPVRQPKAKPMRVVSLSTFHEQCGIATHTEGLDEGFRALRDHGQDVEHIVLSPTLARGDEGWGIQPKRVWNRNRAFGLEALRVVREIEALKPDVVHAQVNLSLFSSRVLMNIALLLKRKGIPFVATLHGRRGGFWGRTFKIWRFEQALRLADVIVHSEDHRRELGRDRVHIISPGLPRRTPRPMLEARKALGLSPDQKVIAHFGFLVPDKGVAEVLRAVAQIPDLFYWVAGAVFGSEESKRHFEELKSMVRELGVEKRVHLTGEFLPEEQAIGELEAANWIVLNYRTGGAQGASGAVRRALAAGRPVAVSEAPVFDDVRRGTYTLKEPLVDSIRGMLGDARLADEYEAKGRALCEEQTWERVAERHIALYRDILNRRS